MAVFDYFVLLPSNFFINFFRDRYRRYKDLYKKLLEKPDNESVASQCRTLEDQLDIANILMAREQAKLEVKLWISPYA